MTPQEKLKLVTHYVIESVDPPRLGATKLNKVLWHADIQHYKRFGKTITGQDSYVRMQHGPVPNDMNRTLDYLKNEGCIFERNESTLAGSRRAFVWLKKADISALTPDEVDALRSAIDVICPQSAARASADTHDALWDEIENLAQIPIAAASVVPCEVEPEDLQWALCQQG